jgi:hypothetical protein
VTYSVRRLELSGAGVVATASSRNTHLDLWRAQIEAEQLARGHRSFAFDQELACWEGSDGDGHSFRYFAVPV